MNDNWDKLLKVILIVAFVYFGLHIFAAAAQNLPPPPTIRCIPAGQGSMTCFPI